jgi:hypothetical protein
MVKPLVTAPSHRGLARVSVRAEEVAVNAPVTAQFVDESLSDGNHAVLLSLGLPAFDGFDVQEVVAQHLLGDGGGIAPALLVDQADLAVVGVPGAGRVEVQGGL